MSSRKKNDSVWIIALSMLYTVGIGGIAIVIVAYFAFQNVSAAPPADLQPPVPTFEIFPTFTLAPGVYYLPTITPNPRSTKIVVETPTPFMLGDGTHSHIIGYSVGGRPIEVYAFGTGRRQRMIIAGIHGGYEWNTIALADELIKHIHKNPDVIPGDVTLYILRNLNPDGDARSHGYEGRVNDRGVDLNRNFPVNWSATWDREGCWDYLPTTGGIGPGSEPETQAVIRFLQTHRVEALISYHSAALGVFPGGEPWDADSSKFAKALAKVTKYPFPPIDTSCIYTGTLADYAVEAGAVAVDMELSTHQYIDFEENAQALKVLLNWDR